MYGNRKRFRWTLRGGLKEMMHGLTVERDKP